MADWCLSPGLFVNTPSCLLVPSWRHLFIITLIRYCLCSKRSVSPCFWDLRERPDAVPQVSEDVALPPTCSGTVGKTQLLSGSQGPQRREDRIGYTSGSQSVGCTHGDLQSACGGPQDQNCVRDDAKALFLTFLIASQLALTVQKPQDRTPLAPEPQAGPPDYPSSHHAFPWPVTEDATFT